MGKKLALITSGAIGLPKTKPDSDPIKKKANPMTRFSSYFSAAPRGDPIICNRGRTLQTSDALSNTRICLILLMLAIIFSLLRYINVLHKSCITQLKKLFATFFIESTFSVRILVKKWPKNITQNAKVYVKSTFFGPHFSKKMTQIYDQICNFFHRFHFFGSAF